MSEPIVVTLEYPIEFQNEEITEIKLRRATGKDLKMLPGNPTTGDTIKLAARLSGHLPVVFDLMDGADITAVLSEVGNLLQSGQGTGGKA